jgi:hypothetical protein
MGNGASVCMQPKLKRDLPKLLVLEDGDENAVALSQNHPAAVLSVTISRAQTRRSGNIPLLVGHSTNALLVECGPRGNRQERRVVFGSLAGRCISVR